MMSEADREEEAVDEAEMPAEQFHQKQAFKKQLQEQVRSRRPSHAMQSHHYLTSRPAVRQFLRCPPLHRPAKAAAPIDVPAR